MTGCLKGPQPQFKDTPCKAYIYARGLNEEIGQGAFLPCETVISAPPASPSANISVLKCPDPHQRGAKLSASI